jgi:hypothetical protein
MTAIFISYRRRGSQGFAGRLADDLTDLFGEEQVFRDVEIRPGDDFAEVIQSAIAGCSALLAVIGPHWLTQKNDKGELRLHEPDDWVRLEIEAALDKKIWVVPVLVGGAQMPASSALPTSLRRLSRIQAFELADRRWDRDIRLLATLITRRLPGLDPPRRAVGNGRDTGEGRTGDSPARALREMGMRVIEEIGRTRSGRGSTTPAATPVWLSIGSHLARLIKKAVGLALLAGVAYFLIQRYGDPGTRRMLNEFVARITALL